MRVVIDGTIGSGKTTQLDLLEKKGWKVHREPINMWPLDTFYKNTKRWAFMFHMIILQTLQPIESNVPVIYERSPISSRYVFWPLLETTEYENSTYEYFYEKHKWHPDIYILLQKSPSKAFEHIQTRGQAGDFGVTMELLENLDTKYKELNPGCIVHVVDAERTPEEIHEHILRIITDNHLDRMCNGHA